MTSNILAEGAAFTAADNLSVSWKHCYLKALGLEDWILLEQSEEYDDDDDPTGENDDDGAQQFQIINLIPKRHQTTKNAVKQVRIVDPWMATAVQIQSNLQNMADWMKLKHGDYVALEMPDEEATLIQSTVTSFTATTANEIESLHSCLKQSQQHQQQPQHPQYHQHCSGIVQILMAQLQQDIAEPWGRWQKVRQRTAVQLWQTPLQCRLWTAAAVPFKKTKTSRSNDTPSSQTTLELLGLDDDDEDDDRHTRRNTSMPPDQRFYPQRPSHILHRHFLESYPPAQRQLSKKPGFVALLGPSHGGGPTAPTVSTPRPPRPSSLSHPKNPPQRAVHEPQEDPWSTTTTSYAALEEESMLLQSTLLQQHGDLDSVQHLEQTMVDITTLLSQFANLVAEQQENVWDIADSAVTTKDNIEKGQENLQQATEATAASRHLLAQGIVAMACLLLLLNWLVA